MQILPEDEKFNETAFLYGQGFFSSIKISRGIPLFIEKHLERLDKSLIDFNMPTIETEPLKVYINKWLIDHKLANGFIRVMVWKQGGEAAVYINGGKLDTTPLYADLLISDVYRHSKNPLHKHKTFNYWANLIAHQDARKSGFYDMLFLNEKAHICETSRSNIFWIKDNKLFTPGVECGLLPGICREIIIETLLDLKIDTYIDSYPLSEILTAQGIFICNSLRGLIEVKSINETKYFEEPALMSIIKDAYWSKVEEYIQNYECK